MNSASTAETFVGEVTRRLGEAPGHLAVVDGVRQMTRQQLFDEARRVGSSLMQRGLARGASVAYQLPNWHEACVVNLAAALYGLRLVPLLPMYREAEIRFILGECDAQAVFLPQAFRGVSYTDLFERAQVQSIPPQHVFTVRGEDTRYAAYTALLQDNQPLLAPTPADRDAVKTVLYTSGSTGHPKGVMHSDRTICALIDFATTFWGLGGSDVALVPSPVGHIGGSMYAFELPWIAGLTALLMDVWNPEVAVDLIESHQVTFCAGATPFLAGLLKAAEAKGTRLPLLKRFICGGASVPPGLIHQAGDRFVNCTVSRAYGSTEVPLVSPGIRSRADATYGATTDGECAADVRLLTEDGTLVATGQPGEIVARAPRMFMGYLNAADNEGALTIDGYFRMGDMGRLVEGRFIEITGRKKDIIIRQGENISPLEVENVLMEHPAIRQIAIVGVPDARTGEAAMAFVVLNDNASLSLAEMSVFLTQRGLARQKFPEHLRIVDALPANSIGKVLKRELQAIAAREKHGATHED